MLADSNKLNLNPIVFAKKLLVLLLKNEFLVGLEWNEGELWRRLYVTKTDPSVAIAVKEVSIILLCKDGELRILLCISFTVYVVI
jgi:hypothetical protein